MTGAAGIVFIHGNLCKQRGFGLDPEQLREGPELGEVKVLTAHAAWIAGRVVRGQRVEVLRAP